LKAVARQGAAPVQPEVEIQAVLIYEKRISIKLENDAISSNDARKLTGITKKVSLTALTRGRYNE
jgi:hypothetical protein